MTPLSSKTYSAILHGDRLEWLGEPPVETNDDGVVRVEVKILGSESHASSDVERRRRAVDALRRLAESGWDAPEDSVAWQREIREDRPLPGREQ